MIEIYVTTELHDFGTTEDGTPFVGEVYFLQFEDGYGRRWNHFARFPGVTVYVDDEGGNRFNDNRDVAKARVERLLARVNAVREVNFTYWNETRPCYGSRAYHQYGQYDDWMEERMAG